MGCPQRWPSRLLFASIRTDRYLLYLLEGMLMRQPHFRR